MILMPGRVAQREREFVEFASADAARLWRTAYLLCRDWHLAEDLTQAALAKVYVAWRRSGAPDQPFAFARTVLTRCFLDHRRRRSSGEIAVAEPPDRPEQSDPDLRLTLFDALHELAPKDRVIVVLRYWDDLGVREVADLLHLSETAVRSRSARALQRLRVVLEGAEDSDDGAGDGAGLSTLPSRPAPQGRPGVGSVARAG